MKNPIINELKELNLISELNFRTINNKTRDSKIKVIKDMRSKIIFLEKFITNSKYYSSNNYTDGRKINKKNISKFAAIKTRSGKIKTSLIEDNTRRAKQFQKI